MAAGDNSRARTGEFSACMLHGEQLLRIETKLDKVVDQQQEMQIRLERGDAQFTVLNKTVDSMSESIKDLDGTVSEFQRELDQQNHRISSAHNAIKGVQEDNRDHSDKIRRTAALDETRKSSNRSGEGWVSITGLLKIIATVGALCAAFFGGNALRPTAQEPIPVVKNVTHTGGTP